MGVSFSHRTPHSLYRKPVLTQSRRVDPTPHAPISPLHGRSVENQPPILSTDSMSPVLTDITITHQLKYSRMSDPPLTNSALSWIREADMLSGDSGVRTVKSAVWEAMSVEPLHPGAVKVTNESWGCFADDHAHAVDVDIESRIVYHCTCDAFKYHPGACKHMVAVVLELDSGELTSEMIGEDPYETVGHPHV